MAHIPLNMKYRITFCLPNIGSTTHTIRKPATLYYLSASSCSDFYCFRPSITHPLFLLFFQSPLSLIGPLSLLHRRFPFFLFLSVVDNVPPVQNLLQFPPVQAAAAAASAAAEGRRRRRREEATAAAAAAAPAPEQRRRRRRLGEAGQRLLQKAIGRGERRRGRQRQRHVHLPAAVGPGGVVGGHGARGHGRHRPGGVKDAVARGAGAAAAAASAVKGRERQFAARKQLLKKIKNGEAAAT